MKGRYPMVISLANEEDAEKKNNALGLGIP